MKYVTIVAAFALSTIPFLAVAQQLPGSSNALRVADNKNCPSVHITMPKDKHAREELNKLDKKVKWDEMCVANLVGSWNKDLKDYQNRLSNPKCDPTLTQQVVNIWVSNHDDKHFQMYAGARCVAKK